MNERIKITICSDTDYEQLIAEIYIDGKFVALISQENGADHLQLEFPDSGQNGSIISRKVEYSLFHIALERARIQLVGPDVESCPMNSLIKPDERQLVGGWESSKNGVIADPLAKRIEYLLRHELVEIARSADGWSVLYQDKNDGRYWELTYPSSALYGGGAPSLTWLSEDEARAKYKI
jgi:hypothetical protein